MEVGGGGIEAAQDFFQVLLIGGGGKSQAGQEEERDGCGKNKFDSSMHVFPYLKWTPNCAGWSNEDELPGNEP
jgi:hypothetical protein